MARDGLFLDTSAIIANLRESDPFHRQARALFQRLANGEFGPLVISEFIIAEAVTVAGIRLGQGTAVTLGKTLRENLDAVVGASGIFAASWTLFASQSEYRLSFVDCSTLVAMEAVGINRLATYDGGFARFAEEQDLNIEIVA